MKNKSTISSADDLSEWIHDHLSAAWGEAPILVEVSEGTSTKGGVSIIVGVTTRTYKTNDEIAEMLTGIDVFVQSSFSGAKSTHKWVINHQPYPFPTDQFSCFLSAEKWAVFCVTRRLADPA